MNQAVDMLKINDTDLLKLDQLEAFRQYLVENKCKTRKGNGNAQLLFVGTSAGWAVVQKGAGGTVKTPIGLRPVIEDFLLCPLNRSMTLARRMRQTQQFDLALAVAAAVVDPAPAPAPLEGFRAPVGAVIDGTQTPLASLIPPADAPAVHGSITGSGDQPVDPAAEGAGQWALGKFVEWADMRECALKGGLKIYRGVAAELEHLEDLRDDLAIHCPLPMNEGEDLAAYADRRWAYADLMMSKRYPMAADK